jgi:hypothetical protein|tara:strand:+ start:6011 stop:7096 length:1086 start_codon:yes stop_codon:yes gene_type:complete
MAIESKIRELLSKQSSEALVEEVIELDEAQKLAPNVKPGDSSSPAQGDSKMESPETLSTDPVDGAPGKAASAKAKKDGTLPKGNGAGDATNFQDMSGKASGLAAEEVVVEDEEIIEDVEVEGLFDGDIDGLFAEEQGLTEEFKTKAASLFEAVVTARVTSEVEEIQTELAEEAVIAQETFMEEMVEKIDGYLNYVSENWMKENELAIEKGLRTEITEDFIKGLQGLFAEHYIEVPTEKYDVLGEMQSQIDSLTSKLDESVAEKLEIVAEKAKLMRNKVFAEATADLTVTESEKLSKLTADVEFDNEELFAEKVTVIKENYFPKVKATYADDKMDDTLDSESLQESGSMSVYTQAITKSVKN